MICLKDEVQYLENIELINDFDIKLYKQIKKFIYKILEMNSFEEIYAEYKKFTKLTNLTFPRIESLVKEDKSGLDLESLKIKIVICSIDRILKFT